MPPTETKWQQELRTEEGSFGHMGLFVLCGGHPWLLLADPSLREPQEPGGSKGALHWFRVEGYFHAVDLSIITAVPGPTEDISGTEPVLTAAS